MDMFLVVGTLVLSAVVWRSLLRAAERTSTGGMRGDGPTLGVPTVIPDTVPPEWIDAYRADN